MFTQSVSGTISGSFTPTLEECWAGFALVSGTSPRKRTFLLLESLMLSTELVEETEQTEERLWLATGLRDEDKEFGRMHIWLMLKAIFNNVKSDNQKMLELKDATALVGGRTKMQKLLNDRMLWSEEWSTGEGIKMQKIRFGMQVKAQNRR
ncbi:hypothetical protein KEM54_000201 [Ascosphaera aggregata]|nr:hypothetical protein KEM54_000201 [Ascosphaera aggregata]